MYVKPADGVLVRLPDGSNNFLDEHGANVPQSLFWFRRLAKGDVVLAERPADRPGPEMKMIEVGVGAMIVAVEPGKDGEFATADDVVTKTPVNKKKKKAEKPSKEE